jgi:hypothetical protein
MVHWAGDGQIQSTILDFVKYVRCRLSYARCHITYTMIFRASKGHTGSYLAARISECLHDYGIQDKVSVVPVVQ